MKKPRLNPSHYLLGVRLDNWLRLLAANKFRVDPEKIPQALMISLASLALSPVALLEAGILAAPLAGTRVEKDPLFIVGHWRSGTTYLQNIMSRDGQFGWADPISTTMMPYSTLLRPFLTGTISKALKTARPMDNMEYSLELPMEEVFGLSQISPMSIIHAISFPQVFQRFIPEIFVEDMTERQRREWARSYSYVLKKLTLHCGGKRLLLKSPDNTGHIRELLRLYPDARFLNIYRDPYVTIMSTLNMFRKQMDILRISKLPDCDFETLLEDTFIYIFGRMYRELFALELVLPKNRFCQVRYEDFTQDPEKHLREIYARLELTGFDEALPRFREYIDSQRDYVKNKFSMPERLRSKINSELGFYFEHYGYETE